MSISPDSANLAARIAEVTERLAAVLSRAEDPIQAKPLPRRRTHTTSGPCVGRDDLLADLAAALTARRQHVCVYGPSGSGKTTLLREAANEGILSADQVPDCDGLLWPTARPLTAADATQLLLIDCYEIAPNQVIPDDTARKLLSDINALIILDNPPIPAEELRELIAAMPHSLFVVTSDHLALPDLTQGLPVTGLSLAASTELMARVLGPLTSQDTDRLAQFWDQCDGHANTLITYAHHLAGAEARHVVDWTPASAERPLYLSRVLARLGESALAVLATLAAFPHTEWGEDLLAAASGAPHRIPQVVAEHLAANKNDRYHIVADVAADLPPDKVPTVEDITHGITLWVALTASPNQAAAECEVITRALKAALARDDHESALSLARAAADKIMYSVRWTAWARILTLGLAAAKQAGSIEDEIYFTYALAARAMANNQTDQAMTLLNLVIGNSHDIGAADVADQARALSTRLEIQHVDLEHAGSMAGLTPVAATRVLPKLRSTVATRLMRAPGMLQLAQFVQANPVVVRAVGLVLSVAILVAATLSASGRVDQATAAAQPDPLPPAPPTSSLVPGPDESTPSGTTSQTNPAKPIGSSPTARPAQPGPGATQQRQHGIPIPPGSTTTSTPPPTIATWGFARDVYVSQPVGTTHTLSGPTNNEANWTFGLWRLTTSPPAIPTATHVSTGVQRIRMPAVGAPGGTVAVTAEDQAAWSGSGQPGVFCQPQTWSQDGTDEVIDVVCFDHAGTRTDVPFMVLFMAETGPNPQSAGGSHGYVTDDQPTAAAFTPDWQHGRDAGPVTRTGTGRYTAGLPGSTGGVTEVSATGTQPRHCAMTSQHGDSVDIACTAPDGTPADTTFTANDATDQNLLDDRRKPVGDYLTSNDALTASAPSITTRWASGNGGATLTRQSTGKYLAHFTNGYLPSTTQVTATGQGDYCDAMFWNDYTKPDDTSVYIACFTSAGILTDTGFDLRYTSARIY